MEQEKEKEGRRWIEEYGGAVLGAGVFVLLGLIVLLGLARRLQEVALPIAAGKPIRIDGDLVHVTDRDGSLFEMASTPSS